MDNYFKNEYIKQKKERRKNKQIIKRKIDANEVIFIFEKLLEGWKTIRIYNTIKQTNSSSQITKKQVENISTGNIKIYDDELEQDRFLYYQNLRKQIYELNNNHKYTENGTT